MLTSTLEVCENMPPIHAKILHHFDMTLHISKRIWAMLKKSKRKNIRGQKHGKKKKRREKKDSPYLKIKDRVM